MLILSRKPGDTIVIGDGIRLVVLECDRREVRIGIEAPPEIKIVRGEIVNQIADENRRATASRDASDWAKVIPPLRKGAGDQNPGQQQQRTDPEIRTSEF